MKNTRREFITKIGATFGALTLGKHMIHAFPLSDENDLQDKLQSTGGLGKDRIAVDFRYAPKDWQTAYCFPDDPYKSLVGKYGDLRYGHAGINQDEKIFPRIISIGLKGKDQLAFLEQKLESPSVPVVTTKLDGGNVTIVLRSFASRHKKEGRVDNMILEIYAKDEKAVTCIPEIILKSDEKFKLLPDGDYGIVQFEEPAGKIFFITDSPLQIEEKTGERRYALKEGEAKQDKPLKYFIRIPQEAQDLNTLEDYLDEPDELLEEVKLYWQGWKPEAGRVSWNLFEPYKDFFVASARNILQAREEKNGKKVFQVGPTVYRGLWVVDGHFLLEAARYLGYDKEAQEGLEAIWDRQDDKYLISAGAGEAHWKDTAVAVYALIRQAELSQNWDYFNSVYPDAFNAIMALKDLRDKAKDNDTMNGKYNLLPKGFGDSGIGGIREEFTNTLWALVALKALDSVATRFFLQKKALIKEFYGELRYAFYDAMRAEKIEHPNGFSYLPMLMKSDARWSDPDPLKRPRPQAAQIYLSHAIYPGLLFLKDDSIVSGHLELMKSVIKEDVTAESGWMSNDAVWPYNAAILAQVFLYQNMPDMARRLFVGFLNHASPLFAWREEQSLQDAAVFDFIGDMPHNWASAECIRFLRHMIVLEEEKNLQLFRGIGLPELKAETPISLIYTPTRWGRVTVSLEPVDMNTWKTKFKREDFDDKTNSKMEYVMMPRKLAGKFYFDKIVGAKGFKEGERSFVRASDTEWECTWKSFA